MCVCERERERERESALERERDREREGWGGGITRPLSRTPKQRCAHVSTERVNSRRRASAFFVSHDRQLIASLHVIFWKNFRLHFFVFEVGLLVFNTAVNAHV